MKKLMIILILVLTCSSLLGEEWVMEADANLTLNQNSYSDNWAGSEVGNVTWAFNANFSADKQFSPIFLNENSLKLAYGQTHRQDEDTDKWQKPTKSTDLVDFESVGYFTLDMFVDPFVSGRLESQFTDKYEDTEKYLNPLTITESFGGSKVLYKKEKTVLTTRLGAAFKQNLNQHSGLENTNDGGFEFVAQFKSPFANDMISLDSRLNIFKAVYYSEEDNAPNDYWKQPDIDWETTFTANISKYIMVNLYTQLLYDKQISLAGRFKQTLSLGVTYKIF